MMHKASIPRTTPRRFSAQWKNFKAVLGSWRFSKRNSMTESWVRNESEEQEIISSEFCEVGLSGKLFSELGFPENSVSEAGSSKDPVFDMGLSGIPVSEVGSSENTVSEMGFLKIRICEEGVSESPVSEMGSSENLGCEVGFFGTDGSDEDWYGNPVSEVRLSILERFCDRCAGKG